MTRAVTVTVGRESEKPGTGWEDISVELMEVEGRWTVRYAVGEDGDDVTLSDDEKIAAMLMAWAGNDETGR
jgi:hypothetical protein